MDSPTRLDLFALARQFVTQRSRRIDPAKVDTEGSDVNIVVGVSSVIGDQIVKQLAQRTAALTLAGSDDEDLDRYAFDRYLEVRKGASPAKGSIRIFRTSLANGAGSIPIGTKVVTDTGIEYVTTTTASLGVSDFTTTARARASEAGKCLGPEDLVLRSDGRKVAAQDVRVGDFLLGPDSAPRRVLGVTSGVGPMYRVVPNNGECWSCNDAHVLTLIRTSTNEVFDVEVRDYLRRPARWKVEAKLFIPSSGVEFPKREDPPVDPYFLGIWFGDGSKDLSSIFVSKPDAEIEAACRDTAEHWGLRLSVLSRDGKCPRYSIASKYPGDPNPLARVMRAFLGDACVVPDAILFGSRVVRASFLAGFLDADGYLDKPGYYEISQRRRLYAEAICFIARSLGIRARMVPKIVNGRTYWRVNLRGHFLEIPMRIPRKISARRSSRGRDPTRAGFVLEPLGDGPYAGFTLDEDGRFLLGDFTVTHNSTEVGVGAIKRFSNPSGLFDPTLQVINDAPMAGGEDAEDDPTMRNRLRGFWRSARRGILAAIEFGALTVPGVVSAQAIEALTPNGDAARIVDLYISDSTGVASDALADDVRIALLDFRGAGIQVLIHTSIPLIVEVHLRLTFRANVDTVTLTDNIRDAVVAFVNSLPVNGPLFVADLFSVLKRFADDGLIVGQNTLVAPVGDLVPSVGQTIRTVPSSVVVEAA